MRCNVKSGGAMLGVMAAVIALFLVGFLFPSLLHSLHVCIRVRACVCMCLCVYVCMRERQRERETLFFLLLLCNAVSDLGKNMSQRDRERAE